MRWPRLRERLRSLVLLAAGGGGALAAGSCGGAQQGYYGPCDEPGGRVLGCPDDPARDDAFTAWDACEKLATCGVILAGDEPESPDQPEPFDRCVDQIEDTFEAQGDLVLVCIEQARCPDLARTDPESVEGEDPNPSQGNIEGVLGYCGRLDP
jgi:hypothetical protein